MTLLNGRAVEFSHRVGDGDRIAVYPPFRAPVIEPAWLASPAPLRELRFLLDGHLGKLARYSGSAVQECCDGHAL